MAWCWGAVVGVRTHLRQQIPRLTGRPNIAATRRPCNSGLTGATETPGTTYNYTYDLAGNRTAVWENGAPVANLSYTDANQVIGWSYDGAGNLLSDGTISGVTMPRVEFTGWQTGFAKVRLTRLFRSSAGLSLAEAKEKVDYILEGKLVIITLPNLTDTEKFVQEAQELGVICKLEPMDGTASPGHGSSTV